MVLLSGAVDEGVAPFPVPGRGNIPQEIRARLGSSDNFRHMVVAPRPGGTWEASVEIDVDAEATSR